MFDWLRTFIFGQEDRPKRFRDRESVFFDMTDENGISYCNMSDTIQYIPVRKRPNLSPLVYSITEALKNMTTALKGERR